jgi:hypothetical protein
MNDNVISETYKPAYLKQISTNQYALIIITFIILIFYILISSLGEQTSKGVIFMEVLLWGIFVMLIVINGMIYIFDIDIIASIKNMISNFNEPDIVVDPDNIVGDQNVGVSTVPVLKTTKQVFHVPDNKYAYDDAKAICSAYGGRLATWKEIDNAYNKGADWCSMGWSDGQMALYPTQYDKWANLQEIDGHEQDCGRPGINGGYIADPKTKFGANCYGYKPKITQDESDAMKLAPLYPTTVREKAFDSRVEYWRNKLPEIFVAPFNHNNWSVF